MRHRKHTQRLSRNTSHRVALLRNLAKALILSKDAEGNYLDRIETTDTKAKALKSFIEPLVTLGKKGQVHHRRLAFARLQDKRAVHRLFEEIAPRFAERNGGYTRLIRTRRRMGDGAEMAYVEFVDRDEARQPAEEETAAASAE